MSCGRLSLWCAELYACAAGATQHHLVHGKVAWDMPYWYLSQRVESLPAQLSCLQLTPPRPGLARSFTAS